MDPSDVGFIKAVVAFILVAGTGFTALRMWLRARQSLPPADQLLDAVRAENAQVQADLEARMAELEERLDFTERRLVQEAALKRLPDPPVHTPV
jgi:hypothetical protein